MEILAWLLFLMAMVKVEQGLFFIAYTKDLNIIDAMLLRMFGTGGDGIHDRMLHFVTPVDGAYYFAPSEGVVGRSVGRVIKIHIYYTLKVEYKIFFTKKYVKKKGMWLPFFFFILYFFESNKPELTILSFSVHDGCISISALLHKDLKCKAPLIEPNLRRNLGKWST